MNRQEEPMPDPVLQSKSILERFRLDGRIGLVTGGGQGIGRAFCHALAEAGARVAVVDISSEAAETVAHELAAEHADSIAVTADVTKGDQVQAMVDVVVKKWSALTIAVNNAGIGEWCSAEEVSRDGWRRILDLNLDAVFFGAQVEARAMFPRRYGKIINTASMSGHIVNTPQNQAAYNTSKAGVIHMTRSLAAEWADRGVRVNSISPGYTKTQLVEDLLATPAGKSMLAAWLPLIPMKRMAEVSDLQGAVVYLASGASDYVTGHDLVIDGGYCVW
jgi:NAD(P)-dependent dehydrogenase (short-subunit alcohol dehydrogenase family)